MITTTAGRAWVNAGLPDDLKDPHIRLDGKSLAALFDRLARERPDEYSRVAAHLVDVGRTSAYRTGGYSFGLSALRRPAAATMLESKLKPLLAAVNARTDLTDDQKRDETVKILTDAQSGYEKAVFEEAKSANNPIALQVLSGSRGKPSTVQTLIGGDLLYQDAAGRGIPVPVFRSYAQGLTPVQYFAGAYGARKGITDTKLLTANAGFLGKQLTNAAHRLVITGLDHDPAAGPDPNADRGLPVDTDDRENAGALLARDVGGYGRNTVLTPKILADLKAKGHDRLLVRSPLTSQADHGGVYARDVGVRERGGLPTSGDQVGIAAAQAVGEIVSQSSLGSKHSGGVGKGMMAGPTGFKLINLLAQAPKESPYWATHAQADGPVSGIDPSPAGGWNVRIGEHEHYVPPHAELKVKPGDRVEAGDTLSSGVPNPNDLVKHFGIGDGRRRFMHAFRDAVGPGQVDRRNLELVTRGLVNHVRMTDAHDEWLPDDVVPYNLVEERWQPREGAVSLPPEQAVGKYLDKPTLHHTVGTRVRPSMVDDMKRFGVKAVVAHPDPPPFEPHYLRGLDNLSADPDWMVRMTGSNLSKSTLKAVHHGDVSDEAGTSFVPSLARTKGFGVTGPVKPYDLSRVNKPDLL